MTALPTVARCAADSQAELLDRLRRGDWTEAAEPADTARWRVAIVEPTAERIDLAAKVVAAGKRWQGRRQVFFSAQSLLQEGKLAFLFPGVDSAFAPRAEDVADFFGEPLPAGCQPADPATALADVVAGVARFNRFTHAILRRLDILPDALAGHSIGEWSAMAAAGMIAAARLDAITNWLTTAAVPLPDVRFLAAACDRAAIEPLLVSGELALSHDNCPHQVIVCGRTAAIDALREALRTRQVLAQSLPIVSGFHSPFFADYLAPYRDFFLAEPLPAPVAPLWSCTTGQPFPAGAAGQQLALDHLVQPVAFRALVENLYAAGCRAFIQLGTGSLTGFVQDTLHDRPHIAIAANSEKCSGLEQLCRLAAALWVEGHPYPVPLLPRRPHPLAMQPSAAAADPLERHFAATLAELRNIADDIVELWQAHRARSAPPPKKTAPREIRLRRELDVRTTIPCVLDHALHPQRADWPSLADCRPVVPLTMELDLLREAIETAFPGQVVTRFEQVSAYNWLCVDQPVAIDIRIDTADFPRLGVRIDGFLDARARVAPAHSPAPPAALEPLVAPRAAAIDADALYRERWMFHGPAYRGVTALGPLGDNGIDGRLRTPSGSGALLDSLGQLAGYWVMEQPDNVLAMPVGIDRIDFYGTELPAGAEFEGRARVRRLDAENCISDLELVERDGRVRVAVYGWRTRRYGMDREFYRRTCQLERHTVCECLYDAVLRFDDRYDTALMRDYLARRYLAEAELARYVALPPRARRAWLNGRIAAKDAVRRWLWQTEGAFDLYPKEIHIDNDADGAPLVALAPGLPAPVQVSIAHKGRVAVALAAAHPVGVDIETIEPRDDDFLRLAFTEAERALLPADDRDAWIARLWAAKEALAKLRRTGLQGRPADFPVRDIAGERVLVGTYWINTSVDGDYAMGWIQDNGNH